MKRLVVGAAILVSLVAITACDDSGNASTPDATPAALDGGADMMAGDLGTAADAAADSGVPTDPTTDGPYAVSYTLTEVTVGERTLPLGIWGPTAAVAEAHPLTDLLAPGHQETFEMLAAEAMAGCVTPSLSVALNAPLADGAWPVILYSHCHECLGISGATVARRLASWGFIVLAPDHVDNTLWDTLDGSNVPLNADFLPVRGADIIGVLDAAQAGALSVLGDTANLDDVGIIGHSFGAVTAGWVAERDARFDAALILAAPVENPLLPGVTAANITVPTIMVLAVEDNSIGAIGNTFLRNNYDALGGPAMKVEIADAGHWSVSDLCGLVEAFDAGCGDGTRQTDGEAFSYLSPDVGRSLTATWSVALFGAKLHGDTTLEAWLLRAETNADRDVARRQWQ